MNVTLGNGQQANVDPKCATAGYCPPMNTCACGPAETGDCTDCGKPITHQPDGWHHVNQSDTANCPGSQFPVRLQPVDTSEQAYTEAQELYVTAYNVLAEARKALAKAEQAFYLAEENLARHEIKPGLPRYAAQS